MLSDFLTLEVYFGSQNAALYFEDLSKRHGRKNVQHAIRNGDLNFRKLDCGPERGRILTWLSEQGRTKANLELS